MFSVAPQHVVMVEIALETTICRCSTKVDVHYTCISDGYVWIEVVVVVIVIIGGGCGDLHTAVLVSRPSGQ